ncbi:MAG TPA: aspartate aminotransferase family protein, partial [Candidatus Binatia bacterium]|nr:aspartate aminotransferase family protein [Candidatus Binatia bacterium]
MIPGPRSRALIETLRRYEARGVTYVDERFPIAWERASGATVVDVDGNSYTDLTSAFGVANVGHSNAAVRAAIEEQAGKMIHGMGDLHPPEVKVRLLERLAAIAPGDLSKTYLASAGAESIEFALKTAYLRTGKAGVVAYRGAYHGLTLGALAVIGIDKFRSPFEPLVARTATFVDFPRGDADAALTELRSLLERDRSIGAVLIEPIQGRAGIMLPPPGYLRGIRALCDTFDLALIFDEIYTGFARTGTMFACEGEGVVPDIMCIGKAFAGGAPLSAAVGRPHVVDAWAPSSGEALHTSTYLGNPLACAAALATIAEIERHSLIERSRSLGGALGERLQRLRRQPGVRDVRGRGMLWGVEFGDAGFLVELVQRALRDGLILLPSGVEGNVLTIAPPLVIEENELWAAIDRLERLIGGS